MPLPGRGIARREPHVLVVCTGNVCRSPYLAAHLRSALPDLRITSAGTRALVGEPPTPQVRAELHRLGLDEHAGVAHALTARQVRAAALVVTAERTHRLRVEQLDPSARERAFTVKELTRALSAQPAAGLADVVAHAAAAARAEALRPEDHDDDLDDPFGLDDAAYRRMFAEADTALRVLIPALGGR